MNKSSWKYQKSSTQQWIQWIMKKSKNSIVTTRNYLSGHSYRYLLPFTTLNRYLSRHSSKNFIFTTSSQNIIITRHGVFLVTIPILCLVMIHWIQWIQRKSFRKNSNKCTKENVSCLLGIYVPTHEILHTKIHKYYTVEVHKKLVPMTTSLLVKYSWKISSKNTKVEKFHSIIEH